jgi:Zn-finger nucleic acid-binding protein
MLCPACNARMLVIEFNDVELDFCPGVWLDRGELGLIIHGQPDLHESHLPRNARRSKRRCPACRRRMRAGPLPEAQVEVDACAHHGIWLDQGELETIVRAAGGKMEKLKDYCAKVFGKSENNSQNPEEEVGT